MDINPNKTQDEEMEVIGADTAVAVPQQNSQLAIFGNTPLTFERADLKMAYGVGIGVEQGFAVGTLFLQSGPRDAARCVKMSVPKMANQKNPDPLNGPVIAIVVEIHHLWREYQKVYVPGVIPREYPLVPGDPQAVPPQAIADGLRAEWLQGNAPAKERGPTVARAIRLGLLVRQPEGVEEDIFCLKLGEHWYAPCWFLAEKQFFQTVSTAVSSALSKDAQTRGVPVSEASMADSFVAITPFARLAAEGGGNVKTSLVFGKHVENGKLAKVSPDLFRDLLERVNSAGDEGGQPMLTDGQDVPY